MKYRVHITEVAEKDILDIYSYVVINDTEGRAENLINKIEDTCATLEYSPGRWHVPPELERVGVGVHREIHFKPYRIVYEVSGKNVYIHGVLDGRRDLQTLLERRLLR